jgi:hypothetical protein
MGRGYTLGGDNNFTQWMTPREAAVVAALARQRQQQLRLRGNRCCRPCVVTEAGGSDNEDEVQVIDVVPHEQPLDTKGEGKSFVAVVGRKRAATPSVDDQRNEKSKTKPKENNDIVIDLTGDDDTKPAAKKDTVIVPAVTTLWACPRCTFLNPSEEVTLCEICLMPKA